jgi:hypothetical protein
MASDDDDNDDADDRYDIEIDSSDEAQGGAGAEGRQSGAMSECCTKKTLSSN